MFTVGEKIKVGGKIMTVKKVKPDAVLLRGWGTQKWYDIEQVKQAIETQTEFVFQRKGSLNG